MLEDCGGHCGSHIGKGAVMPGSNAEDIVWDYFESDDWAEQVLDDNDAEPDLELPPLPPTRT
jgi:hypothetical protein